MLKTLRISFSLKNTYRVNAILYSLKQIPGLKKLLPNKLYQVRGFKIFANILSFLGEVISIFLGKILYYFSLISMPVLLFPKVGKGDAFLHILFFLSLMGKDAMKYLFDVSKPSYYAILMLNMDAKEYTLVHFFYEMAKLFIGTLPVCLYFGLPLGVPLWLGLLIPFAVVGIKLTDTALLFRKYEKKGILLKEDENTALILGTYAILFAMAYGLPYLGWTLPRPLIVAGMVLSILAGLLSLPRILSFDKYREIYRYLLLYGDFDVNVQEVIQKESQKQILQDKTITSEKEGLAYLNDLFIKRHKKLLWKGSLRTTAFLAGASLLGMAIVTFVPSIRGKVNHLLMTALPWFVFLMFLVNRGSQYTQALFINSDHSLLTYSFFRKPENILKLFWLRMVAIIKINLPPALVTGLGLAGILYLSGGTSNPWNYLIIILSLLSFSVFFSVHYLTLYYLLQPYNGETEVKSGSYQIILALTNVICYFLIKIKVSTTYFGMGATVFCLIYSIIANYLVFKLGPKTFRLRA